MRRIAILLLLGLGLGILLCSCDADEEKIEPTRDRQNQEKEETVNPPTAQGIEKRTGRGLRGYEKDLLGLMYDREVLEAARVHVGRPKDLPNGVMWGLIVQIAVQNGYGVTVGDDMYFPEEPDCSEPWGVQWLAHELRHVDQYRQAGGLEGFAAGYLWYMMAGTLSLNPGSAYLKNPFENDARVFDECMVELLSERPELLQALATKVDERGAKVREQLDEHAVEYREIIARELSGAKKAPTRFVISEQKSFTIDFHLRGEWTEPVGGEIDLRPKDEQ